jgi:AcrR family transcriptional regulator
MISTMKQAERTKETKNKILRAAIAEFGRVGYQSGALNAVCRSGINKGLIYHHFGNKKQLYLACLQASCEQMMHCLAQDPPADIQQYLDVRLYFIRTYPEESRIFFEALLDPPADCRKEVEELLKPFHQYNEQMTARILQSVTLRAGVSAASAETYLSMMQEMFNSYFTSGKFHDVSWSERLAAHEQAIHQIADYILYGIAEGERKS